LGFDTPLGHDLTETVEYRHRSLLDHEELQRLFELAGGARKIDFHPVLDRSFMWIAAYAGSTLIGFVNVAWDGGVHFFLLDTTVHPDWQRRGVGTRLVREAIAACQGAGEWMHVDFDDELTEFYRRCGFSESLAGVLALGRPIAVADP
jgi:GNAT superfamily N-acetyltransferase